MTNTPQEENTLTPDQAPAEQPKPDLTAETQQVVSKMSETVEQIIKNPGKYGLPFAVVNNGNAGDIIAAMNEKRAGQDTDFPKAA